MKTNRHILLLLLALLTACTEEASPDRSQGGGTADPLADYDGPLAVCVTLADGNKAETRAHAWDLKADDYFGDGTTSYPFPTTQFADGDEIGIIHVVSERGTGTPLTTLCYKATLSVDGSGTVTGVVAEGQGDAAGSSLRHFAGHDNYYYAYYPFSEYPEPQPGTHHMALMSDDTPLVDADTPATDFFAPMTALHPTRHDDQSTTDLLRKADLLAAKGSCMTSSDGTATLTLTMQHQLAMRIVRLEKWNGWVTLYGSYDTWVAPDGTIWRMKQRLEPVEKHVCEARWPEQSPLATYYEKVVDRDGQLSDTEQDDDQARYFFKLVSPDTGTEEGAPIGYARAASEGGWLLDMPPVPAGQYVMVKPLYFHWFRPPANSYGEDSGLTDADGLALTVEEAAMTAWNSNKEKNIVGEWEKNYLAAFPYTWTYEQQLFPYTDGDRQQYDYVLQVGDLLLPSGNIVKDADDNAYTFVDIISGEQDKRLLGPTGSANSAVGRVMWIAWGCKEYFDDASNWDDDGMLSGTLNVLDLTGRWRSHVSNVSDNDSLLTGIDYFPEYYVGINIGGGRGTASWTCIAYGHRDDNGYRAKGKEETTTTDIGDVRHFVVDHTQYGLSSLDDYWNHELCNHFLVFAFNDEAYSGAYDDTIFQSDISVYNDEALYESGYGWTPCRSENNFLSTQTFDNDADRLRSKVRAADYTAKLPWMVPTIPQYEVALCYELEYDEETDILNIGLQATSIDNFLSGALLSSSRLKESGEGLVLTCKTMTATNTTHYTLYMGTWDEGEGEVPHYYDGPLRHDDLSSYINHIPISKADGQLHVNGQATAPPTHYRPCIAF